MFKWSRRKILQLWYCIHESKSSLKSLSESNSGEKKLFKCGICDSRFKCKQNLSRHKKAVHEGEKPFGCSRCFSQNDQSKKHIYSVHEKKKPFKCNICAASFTTKGSTLHSCMRELSLSNTPFAMLATQQNQVWIIIFQQSMKESNLSNAPLVIVAVQHNKAWIYTLHQFMMELNPSNVQFVMLTFH